jgi:hypothetical protein
MSTNRLRALVLLLALILTTGALQAAGSGPVGPVTAAFCFNMAKQCEWCGPDLKRECTTRWCDGVTTTTCTPCGASCSFA